MLLPACLNSCMQCVSTSKRNAKGKLPTLQVKTMQQSNQELRTLLNQYLASAVNDELQVPPTQIL